MQVLKIQNNGYNTAFGAGNVILEGIEPQEIQQYESVKQIAEMDKLDLSIKRHENASSPFFQNEYMYMITAQKENPNTKKVICGASCVDISKSAKPEEVSSVLYKKVIRAVERLAMRMQEATGQKTEFLKYLKK